VAHHLLDTPLAGCIPLVSLGRVDTAEERLQVLELADQLLDDVLVPYL
jgi:hypothetical protein